MDLSKFKCGPVLKNLTPKEIDKIRKRLKRKSKDAPKSSSSQALGFSSVCRQTGVGMGKSGSHHFQCMAAKEPPPLVPPTWLTRCPVTSPPWRYGAGKPGLVQLHALLHEKTPPVKRPRVSRTRYLFRDSGSQHVGRYNDKLSSYTKHFGTCRKRRSKKKQLEKPVHVATSLPLETEPAVGCHSGDDLLIPSTSKRERKVVAESKVTNPSNSVKDVLDSGPQGTPKGTCSAANNLAPGVSQERKPKFVLPVLVPAPSNNNQTGPSSTEIVSNILTDMMDIGDTLSECPLSPESDALFSQLLKSDLFNSCLNEAIIEEYLPEIDHLVGTEGADNPVDLNGVQGGPVDPAPLNGISAPVQDGTERQVSPPNSEPEVRSPSSQHNDSQPAPNALKQQPVDLDNADVLVINVDSDDELPFPPDA